MNDKTSPDIGQQLEKALKDAGYEYIPRYRLLKSKVDDGIAPLTVLEFAYISLTRDIGQYFHSLDATYTMGELHDMLKPEIISKGIRMNMYTRKIGHVSEAWYGKEAKVRVGYMYDGNKNDALAQLVMWCIENNHELNIPKK